MRHTDVTGIVGWPVRHVHSRNTRFFGARRDSAAGGASSEAEFPDQLRSCARCRRPPSNPTSLLARADNDFAPQERDVIVEHCIALAGRQGIKLIDPQIIVFSDYISAYRPSMMQLDPALHRLADSSHDEVGDLLVVAKAVVEADGITQAAEARFLANLSEELVTLKTGA